MTESPFRVIHARVTPDRPIADVRAAFERRLGRSEPDVYRSLAEGGAPAAVRARLEAMAGPSGFMLFGTSDHGGLLARSGIRNYLRTESQPTSYFEVHPAHLRRRSLGPEEA
jgi:hypothetical protein